jgi:hypothetical protein
VAAHALAPLDSYVYGFALQEPALPFDGPETVAGTTEAFLQRFPAQEYPHLAEPAGEHVLTPGYDLGDEFAFGLDPIIDGLSRVVSGPPAGTPPRRAPSPRR